MLKKFIYVVVGFGLSVVAFAGETKPAAKPTNPMAAMFAPPPPPAVLIGKVGEINETGVKKYVGQVVPIEDVTLKIRVAGVLEKINFHEGEMVKAGDLLFEIEDTTYRAQAHAAAARLEQINAELAFAEKNYKRHHDLSQNKVIAQSALDEATRLINLTKARQAEAEASKLDAETNLSYTRIYAPISGRISKSTYTKGNFLQASSSPLATIVQVSPIYVRFAMSEPDYISLFGSVAAVKDAAVVRLRTADRHDFSEIGAVTLVDNRVDPQTGTLNIWATFANNEAKLIPGGLVDVTVTKKIAEKMLAVKITAVVTTRDGHAVYGYDAAEKTVSLRPVEVGGLIGDLQIIEKGLQLGEPIVIDGVHKLRNGMVVNPTLSE